MSQRDEYVLCSSDSAEPFIVAFILWNTLLVNMNPIRIFCQMPWDFRVDGYEKKLNPCTMDWAIFVVPTAQCERKVSIIDSLRFPSLGPSLGTIHHPEWRLPATNPMIQVIWNFELNLNWRNTRCLPQLCTSEDAFPAACAFFGSESGR